MEKLINSISKDVEMLSEISIIFSFWYDRVCKDYSEVVDSENPYKVKYFAQNRQNMKDVLQLILLANTATGDIFMRNECQPYSRPNTLPEVTERLNLNEELLSLIKNMYSAQTPKFIEDDDIKFILKIVKSSKLFNSLFNNR